MQESPYSTVTDFDIIGNGDVFVRATDSSPSDKTSNLPLSGVRVLELGQLIAGPFTGQLLGCVAAFSPLFVQLSRACSNAVWWGKFGGLAICRHFGAEIIKVEPPRSGDALRVWRELDVDGTSPWFRSLARNKKSVTIDMRKEEGRAWVFNFLLIISY